MQNVSQGTAQDNNTKIDKVNVQQHDIGISSTPHSSNSSPIKSETETYSGNRRFMSDSSESEEDSVSVSEVGFKILFKRTITSCHDYESRSRAPRPKFQWTFTFRSRRDILWSPERCVALTDRIFVCPFVYFWRNLWKLYFYTAPHLRIDSTEGAPI